MSRKSKIDPVWKVELVERYLRNEIGVMEAARLAGLSSHKYVVIGRLQKEEIIPSLRLADQSATHPKLWNCCD